LYVLLDFVEVMDFYYFQRVVNKNSAINKDTSLSGYYQLSQ
jgi:hypothetical protein